MYLAIIIIAFLNAGCKSAEETITAVWVRSSLGEAVFKRAKEDKSDHSFEITCADGSRKLTNGSEVFLSSQWALATDFDITMRDILSSFCASDADVSSAFEDQFADQIIHLRDAAVEPSSIENRAAFTTVPKSVQERATVLKELAFDETAYLRLLPNAHAPADTVYYRVSRALSGIVYAGSEKVDDATIIRVVPGGSLPESISAFKP